MIVNPIINWVVVLVLALILLGFYVFATVRKKQDISKKIFGITRIFLILLLCFIICLRPQRKKYNMDVEMKNIDVLFVIDSTMSMWAQDMAKDEERMAAVRKDCHYIIEELNGSNFGLIRFDNRGQILAPFTQDADTVEDAITTIKPPSRYYAVGTTLNVAYKEMEELLISSSKKEDRQTILFFISDGEVTDGSAVQSFQELGQYVNGGAVLGYGSLTGGVMRDYSLSYSKSLLRDPETGKDAISVLNEGNLGKIADDLDIPYIHMTERGNIEYLIQSIKNGSSITISSKDAIVYEDVYFYFVWMLLGLMSMELFIIIRYRHL